MQLGVDGVFVGSGIFKSDTPAPRAVAMSQAVTHFKDAETLAKLSTDLGKAMVGEPRKDAMDKEKQYANGDPSKIWNSTLGSGYTGTATSQWT